jgi:hypothetical protein
MPTLALLLIANVLGPAVPTRKLEADCKERATTTQVTTFIIILLATLLPFYW